MRRLLIGVVLALVPLLLVGEAQAVTLVLPDGRTRPQPYQHWADASRMPTVQGPAMLAFISCAEDDPMCSGNVTGPLGPFVIDPGAEDATARRAFLGALGGAFFHRLPGYLRNGYTNPDDFPRFYGRCAQPGSRPHLEDASRRQVLATCRFICRAVELVPVRFTTPAHPRPACQRR